MDNGALHELVKMGKGTIWTLLVSACVLSCVSGRTIDENDVHNSHMSEYPDKDIESMDEIILEHTQELIKLAVRQNGDGVEGKLICTNSVRTQYAVCRALCNSMDFTSKMVCKTVMFKKLLANCFGTSIECYGDVTTTPATDTTSSGTVTTPQPVSSGRCGISGDSTLRVSGGNTVGNEGRYPWQVGLSTASGTSLDYKCSGTIITERHILTAANCFDNNEVYTIGLGSANEKSPRLRRTQSERIIHDNYNRITNDNNIAIIVLSRKIDFDDDDLTPICLANNGDSIGVTAIVTGWGDKNAGTGNPGGDWLEEGRIQVDDCPETTRYTSNMICSTVGTPPVDACKGDEGGPLISGRDSQFHQIGIISHGTNCGTSGATGAYTKVKNYIDWIKSKVSPEPIYQN